MKRGQITIFFIIAVIILFIAGSIFFAKEYIVKKKVKAAKEEALPLNVQPVKLFVEGCLKEVSEEAVAIVEFQGGYILPPKKEFIYEGFDVPILSSNGTDIAPTADDIQKNVNDYIAKRLPECFDNFSQFDNLEISLNTIKISSIIAKNGVSIDANIPLDIRSGKRILELERFQVVIPSNLRKFVDMQKRVLSVQSLTPDRLPLKRFVNIGDTDDGFFSLVRMGNIIIYDLRFNDTSKRPELFRFAVSYPWGETG